ncbi:rap guanine nucleotide exchange factor 1-like protein [Lates japonicus]|uniref:Rap guanine nucleotide exchange factor 1-like protein n=1 Tax=Lates japonicus TaxID=270547 RepID=A0AAD3RH82_LATJO|nr:rap guanine nucleotide exchange factor 1-like protein [Lates japonicus]
MRLSDKPTRHGSDAQSESNTPAHGEEPPDLNLQEQENSLHKCERRRQSPLQYFKAQDRTDLTNLSEQLGPDQSVVGVCTWRSWRRSRTLVQLSCTCTTGVHSHVTTVIRAVLDGVKDLVRLAAERQEGSSSLSPVQSQPPDQETLGRTSTCRSPAAPEEEEEEEEKEKKGVWMERRREEQTVSAPPKPLMPLPPVPPPLGLR